LRTPKRPRRPSRQALDPRFLHQWAILAVVLTGLLAAGGYGLLHARTMTLQEERDRLAVQAHVIEDNLMRQLEGVGNALSGMRYDLITGDTQNAPGLPLRLRTLSEAMPGVRGLMVVDAAGRAVQSSRPQLVGEDVSRREYFTTVQRDPDDAALFVSAPFRAMDNVFVVNLSKSMHGTDGEFAGIVTASLDPDYFTILARSVLYAPDMAVLLAHGSGQVFLAVPQDRAQPGLNVNTPGSMFRQYLDAGRLSHVLQGIARNGTERMVAMRTLTGQDLRMDRPLIVIVSRDVDAVLHRWRESLALSLVFFVALAIVLSGTLYLEQRRRQVLSDSQKRFEFGLRGADLGLWDWDIARGRMFVNDREWELLGYRPGEVELTPDFWTGLLHPDDRPLVRRTLRPHLAGRQGSCQIEHRMRHKKGHWIWVLDHAMVVARDATGKAARILGTHLDVSARKNAEAALAATNHRLELAMKAGNIGLFDWHVPSGRIVVNEEGQAMLGMTTGVPLVHVDQWRELRHPDDEAQAQAMLAPLLEGAENIFHAEYRVRHADGHYLWIRMRAEAVGHADDGSATRVVGAYRDVSQRRLAEDALARAADLQKRTGELAKVGGWEIDLQAMTLTWTSEVYRIHELDIGSGIQPSLEDAIAFYAPESQAAIRQAIGDTIEFGRPWDLELQVVTARKRLIWVRSQGAAVLFQGRAAFIMGSVQDVTDRKQFELELHEANERLSQISLTDGLTGIANRRCFDLTLEAEWSRGARQRQPLALLMIDIDHFKRYNDALGHPAGDACLRAVADALADCIRRPGELLARYGGEEFAILLLDTSLAGAEVVAQRCLDRIRRAALPHAHSPTAPHVTLSIGVASRVPSGDEPATRLVAEADACLYRAKARGRDRSDAGTGAGPEPDPVPGSGSESGSEA
jgi:diguanylate cyclase (GGDEF)-like protein/PAS domain S-box-containing protein